MNAVLEFLGLDATSPVWRWCAGLAAATMIALVGLGLGRVVLVVLTRAVRRTTVTWDDAMLERLAARALVEVVAPCAGAGPPRRGRPRGVAHGRASPVPGSAHEGSASSAG